MEDGNSLIAVSLASSSSRHFIPLRFSGILLSLEQPDKMRVLRDDNLHMTFGRIEMFLQSLKLSKIMPDKFSNDGGSSIMAVSSKKSFDKHVIFFPISGNFLSLEQPERFKVSRNFKLILLGRLLRDLQSCKFNRISFSRAAMDG